MIPETIRHSLISEEQVLWNGQPIQGVLFRRSDFFMIPFSIFWLGVVFLAFNAGGFSWLLPGILLILLVVFLLVDRFSDARRRTKTWYIITNKRIIIYSGMFSQKEVSLDILYLSAISLCNESPAYGSVFLGSLLTPGNFGSPKSHWPKTSHYRSPIIHEIENPEKVYDLLKKILAQ